MKKLLYSISIVGALLFVGCGGSKSTTLTPAQKKTHELENKKKTDSFNKVKERISKLDKDSIDFYLPNSYQNIQEDYKKLQDLFYDTSSDKEEYQEYLTRINKKIDNTYLALNREKTIIDPVITQYKILNRLGVKTVFKERHDEVYLKMINALKDFDETGGGLFSIFSEDVLAVNKKDFALLSEESAELKKLIVQLQIDTVVEIDYKPIEKQIKLVGQTEVPVYAPFTFQRLKSLLKNYQFVTYNDHLNSKKIETMKNGLLSRIKNVKHIERDSKMIERLYSNEQRERFILQLEEKYKKIGESFNIKNIDEYELDRQLDLILEKIESK